MAGKPLRVVQVGCGGISNAWIGAAVKVPNLMQYVGLVDVRRQAAEEKAAKHGLGNVQIFDNLKDALKATRPDVVFDTTIPDVHDQVTIQALKAGCHVLGEKPMSDTLSKARKMVQAARQAGKLYAVTQTRRLHPVMLSAIKLLRSGAIGQIEEVHCDFYLAPHFGGFRDQMPFPLIVDMAIHTFDNARQIAGADPVSAYCHSFNPARSWYKGHVSGVCIFEMTDRIVYSYRGSWAAEGCPTSWNASWRIVGSKGTLLWDGENQVKAQALKKNGKTGFFQEIADLPIPQVKVEHSGHAGLIYDFLNAVRKGRKPLCPCEDNIKSLAMVISALDSAKKGKKVKVAW